MGMKKNLKNEEMRIINEAEGGKMWWFCDTCLKGIPEGHQRYECRDCQDFCECRECFQLQTHPHQLKKKVVPKGCSPLDDDEIKKIV